MDQTFSTNRSGTIFDMCEQLMPPRAIAVHTIPDSFAWFHEDRGGSRIFFRRGCTRLLLYFNTNKPHRFFLQNTSCIRKPQVISGGGGAHPLHPPPRSAPGRANPYSENRAEELFWNSKDVF